MTLNPAYITFFFMNHLLYIINTWKPFIGTISLRTHLQRKIHANHIFSAFGTVLAHLTRITFIAIVTFHSHGHFNTRLHFLRYVIYIMDINSYKSCLINLWVHSYHITPYPDKNTLRNHAKTLSGSVKWTWKLIKVALYPYWVRKFGRIDALEWMGSDHWKDRLR